MFSLSVICISQWLLTLAVCSFMLRYAYLTHAAIDRGSALEAKIQALKAFGVTLFSAAHGATLFFLSGQIPALRWTAGTTVVLVALAGLMQLQARYRLRHEC